MIKKIFTILLAVTLLLSLTATSFAAEANTEKDTSLPKSIYVELNKDNAYVTAANTKGIKCDMINNILCPVNEELTTSIGYYTLHY